MPDTCDQTEAVELDTAKSLRPLDKLAVPADEAAALCGVSERHWRGLDTRGLVPAPVRLGASPRWSVDELRAWLGAGCPSRERWLAIRAAAERLRK